ncbi:MAG: hypothetical protein JSW27_06885 [Phycisphaerales bacterium]|nr:MAG: hypothetical protein JSW27_06885 [Phycisphaerales bacterium]
MKRTVSLPISFIVAILICHAPGTPRAFARTWPPAQRLELKQVALFKNGLGFFVAETMCPADRADFHVILPAVPAHGTFWISYPSDVDLVNAVARETEWGRSVEAMTIPELLAANVGRDVLLAIGDKEFTGTITHCAVSGATPTPRSYYPSAMPSPSGRPRPPIGTVMIQTEIGLVCANPNTVTSVVFVGDNVQRQFTEQTKKAEIQMHLRAAAPGRKVAVTFLAAGVTWAPSYMVDISDEKKARISAKAVIVNEACELGNVDVQLVTGFPHLQFSGIVSPMAMKQNLAQFLEALSRGQSGRGGPGIMDNVMTQRVTYGGMGGGMADAVMPAYGAAEAGTVAEDLFLYPAGNISLDRNEVAYVPLFTDSVPYEHVYQWDIPDYVTEQDRYDYGRVQSEGDDIEQEIWHSLRLTNTMSVPWTTAPGETVSGGNILGQDTLKYTPPGAETTLRITRAIGIKGDQAELETNRQRNAMVWRNQQYDRVTIKGELSLLNSLAKPVILEITKTLSGETKSVEPDAMEEKLAKGLRRINPTTKLTWTVDLAPGAEQKLSYTYEVYVR